MHNIIFLLAIVWERDIFNFTFLLTIETKPGPCNSMLSLRLSSTDLYVAFSYYSSGLCNWLSGKESTGQCRRLRRHAFYPWVRKIPWRRKWQTIPVFLPGKFHGQRSLAAYSTWSHIELDTTERAHYYCTTVFFICDWIKESISEKSIWYWIKSIIYFSPNYLKCGDFYTSFIAHEGSRA